MITEESGKATGNKLAIRNMEGSRVYLGEGLGMGNMHEVLVKLEEGDMLFDVCYCNMNEREL